MRKYILFFGILLLGVVITGRCSCFQSKEGRTRALHWRWENRKQGVGENECRWVGKRTERVRFYASW